MPQRTKRPLTLDERRKAAAKNFDVFGYFQTIIEPDLSLVDYEAEFVRLHRLIRARAKHDPLAFAQQMVQHGFSTLSYLALRTDFYIQRLIRPYDAQNRTSSRLHLPPEVIEMLPNLLQMNEHLIASAEAIARLARQAELARAKKLENDLTEKLQPGHASAKKKVPVGDHKPAKNGRTKPINGTAAVHGAANGTAKEAVRTVLNNRVAGFIKR